MTRLIGFLFVTLICAAAEFPPPSGWPENEGLPDPLVRRDGSRLTDPAGWSQHRAYLKAMLAHYQYGEMPPVPQGLRIESRTDESALDGAAVRILGVIPLEASGRRVALRLGIQRPAGEGPFPVIVKNDIYRFDGSDIADPERRQSYQRRRRFEIEGFVAREAVRRGYAIVKFIRGDLAADHDDNRESGVFPLYPGYDWGTIAVWAWGHSVVLSALANEPQLDLSRNAATGHSRGGKTALCAGIYDERITVTAPNSSGTGGTGSARFFDPEQKPQTIAYLEEAFPYWWNPRFFAFSGIESRMPFDAHTAKALIAPRALINTHARQDYWANPHGTYRTHLAARKVFAWLGVEDRCAIHWRDGGHNQREEDWLALFDFCDREFFGKRHNRLFNEGPGSGAR